MKDFLGGIVLMIAFALILMLPMMWLWNWLIPVLFGLPKITVLQALGICVLSRMIFGGFNVSKK